MYRNLFSLGLGSRAAAAAAVGGGGSLFVRPGVGAGVGGVPRHEPVGVGRVAEVQHGLVAQLRAVGVAGADGLRHRAGHVAQGPAGALAQPVRVHMRAGVRMCV